MRIHFLSTQMPTQWPYVLSQEFRFHKVLPSASDNGLAQYCLHFANMNTEAQIGNL